MSIKTCTNARSELLKSFVGSIVNITISRRTKLIEYLAKPCQTEPYD